MGNTLNPSLAFFKVVLQWIGDSNIKTEDTIKEAEFLIKKFHANPNICITESGTSKYNYLLDLVIASGRSDKKSIVELFVKNGGIKYSLNKDVVESSLGGETPEEIWPEYYLAKYTKPAKEKINLKLQSAYNLKDTQNNVKIYDGEDLGKGKITMITFGYNNLHPKELKLMPEKPQELIGAIGGDDMQTDEILDVCLTGIYSAY